MKYFPVLRTKRITARIRELSIGESIEIASMPDHAAESECTAFLRHVVTEVITGEKDPAKWTVQERTLAVAHYLAVVVDDGPDFSVGSSHYSDYLDGSADIDADLNSIDIGVIGDDSWSIRHLTGEMAESIERLHGESGIPDRLHWLMGAMAAQLIRKGEEIPGDSGGGAFDEWLLTRIKILTAFPDSDFEQLFFAFDAGREKLHHLFSYEFDEHGIVVLPRQGGAGTSPARFQTRACLSRLALSMVGKHD